MIEAVFVEGLIYGIMAFGVFITFRVLDFPDLTVDGSFPLGAAVMGICLTSGIPLLFGLFLALLAGAAAGCLTAVIHNEMKVPSLLAGILTMTMLYSLNIRILGGRANLPLLRQSTMISVLVERTRDFLNPGVAQLFLFLLIIMVVILLLSLFFHSDLGLSLGALGGNERMVVALGSNPKILRIIGVSLSNGLVGLSGAFAAQYQGFADVNLGQGLIISGLAMVMMGEFLIKSNRITWLLARVILGAFVYKGLMFAGRYYGYLIRLTPSDLKLITGLLIILSLLLTKTNLQKKLPKMRRKK